MKAFIKKWADKLSNYKLLARIMICLSLFVAVVVILAFVAFQISKGKTEQGNYISAFGAGDPKLYEDTHHQVMGMFVFLTFIATLVIAIVVIYTSLKLAFPKGKVSPRKSNPILCVVDAGLCLVDAAFCVVAVVYDHSLVPVFWYVVMALFIVAALVNSTMLLPILKSHYYMPKLPGEEKAKEEEKK